MFANTILTTVLGLAALSTAAPSAASPAMLGKRDTCTMFAKYSIYQDVFGGNPTAPPTTDMSLTLTYVGGVAIGGYRNTDLKSNGPNVIAMDGVTIPANTIGLPQDIHWQPEFSALSGFGGCSASYEGQDVKGYTSGAYNPCEEEENAGPGWTCSWCGVDFGCESNLHQ
ncbi:hypothetical protein GQ53DRAFT_811074 [Thozetella sp. PMI_491]|nr:hypothetical protein GQ53DRAFT_811074 [Thozetella sp. PMI_491]